MSIKKFIVIGVSATIFAMFILVIEFRNELGEGVISGINYSLSVLIPSLFPIMLVSCMASNSVFAFVISRAFSPVVNRVFRLSSYCALPLIFGLISGYPVGAKMTNNLLKSGKISEKEAKRLLLFCVNPGLSFCIVYVGGVIFNDTNLGLNIFVSTAISSLILAFVSGFTEKKQKKTLLKMESVGFVKCIKISAEQSLKASVNMCLYVVVFSAFLPLLTATGMMDVMANLLSQIGIFSENEYTGIIYFIADVVTGVSEGRGLDLSSEIFVFGLSFGGLCVHFQVFSMFKNGIVNFKKFYLYRIIGAVISVYVFRILCFVNGGEVATISTVNQITSTPTNTTAMGSACLIILVISFLVLNKNEEKSL